MVEIVNNKVIDINVFQLFSAYIRHSYPIHLLTIPVICICIITDVLPWASDFTTQRSIHLIWSNDSCCIEYMCYMSEWKVKEKAVDLKPKAAQYTIISP